MVGKILKYFCVLATCTCFAQEANDVCDDEIIHQIAANQDTCVIGFAEERIYLNPNRIYPTEQGLYLNLNDVDYVLLSSLNSDFNGCYVRPLSRPHSVLNRCPGCGQKYFIICKNENCPLFQRNEERKREKERQKEEEREQKRQEKEKKKEEKRKNKK